MEYAHHPDKLSSSSKDVFSYRERGHNKPADSLLIDDVIDLNQRTERQLRNASLESEEIDKIHASHKTQGKSITSSHFSQSHGILGSNQHKSEDDQLNSSSKGSEGSTRVPPVFNESTIEMRKRAMRRNHSESDVFNDLQDARTNAHSSRLHHSADDKRILLMGPAGSRSFDEQNLSPKDVSRSTDRRIDTVHEHDPVPTRKLVRSSSRHSMDPSNPESVGAAQSSPRSPMTPRQSDRRAAARADPSEREPRRRSDPDAPPPRHGRAEESVRARADERSGRRTELGVERTGGGGEVASLTESNLQVAHPFPQPA